VSASVSFVVPVHNGATHLDTVLTAIIAAASGRLFEVIVVDDASSDDSAAIALARSHDAALRVIAGDGHGAAAAINMGVAAAAYPVVCQVDQDVILQPGWLEPLLDALADPEVAAAQGYYVVDPAASPWARVAGLDLVLRWSRLETSGTDHVCTGNTAYQAAALGSVGGFDESLGYGYDNDMSYRLGARGLRLVLCPAAKAVHRFREGLLAYLVQQYGLGYGRLDLIARHPGRVAGDRVSGLGMILQVPATMALVAAGAAATGMAILGGPWQVPALAAAVLLGALVTERGIASVGAWRLTRDPAALLMLPAHLLRNLAWVAATLAWSWRRLSGRPGLPAHSMPRS
jgi:hypothetical protein